MRFKCRSYGEGTPSFLMTGKTAGEWLMHLLFNQFALNNGGVKGLVHGKVK